MRELSFLCFTGRCYHDRCRHIWLVFLCGRVSVLAFADFGFFGLPSIKPFWSNRNRVWSMMFVAIWKEAGAIYDFLFSPALQVQFQPILKRCGQIGRCRQGYGVLSMWCCPCCVPTTNFCRGGSHLINASACVESCGRDDGRWPQQLERHCLLYYIYEVYIPAT